MEFLERLSAPEVMVILIVGIAFGIGVFAVVCDIVPTTFQSKTAGLAGPIAGLCMASGILIVGSVTNFIHRFRGDSKP